MRRLVKAIRRAYSGKEKGFTLIELLVVIGILAAIAGVVTIAVTQFIGRGQNEACQTDLHNVQTAVAACMVENSSSSAASCDTSAELIPTYLLQAPLADYTVSSIGVVTQGTCPVRDTSTGQPNGTISAGT
jgi:prepilin-type N-terminal cleavage/methylation domain-containing protein